MHDSVAQIELKVYAQIKRTEQFSSPAPPKMLPDTVFHLDTASTGPPGWCKCNNHFLLRKV